MRRMDRLEKRRYRRLKAAYNISCRKIGSSGNKSYEGCTVNVGTGGLYFETVDNVFGTGELLKIELTIQPTSGLLEFGGKIAGFAKVIRACDVTDSAIEAGFSSGRYGVAVEFCRAPKLCL